MTHIIKIHNATTGEIIEREMNAEELEQYEVDKAKRLAAVAQKQAEAEAKAAQKAALLDRLGITEDEAKLLLA
jgi:hypothetical protein